MEHFETDVVILGAGLTGLVIADLLASAGIKAVLVEKSGDIGGLAKTVKYRGFKFDLGGHRLYFKDEVYWRYLQSVAGNNNLSCHNRKSAIFLCEKLFRYPPDFSSLFSHGFLNTVKSFSAYLKADKGPKSGFSLKDWAICHFGAPIYNVYFRDYSHKLWGISAEEMSGLWAEKRIGNYNLSDLAKDFFLKLSSIKENSSNFYYPAEGIGLVCDKIFQRIEDKTRVIFGVEALGVDSRGGSLRSLFYERKGNRGILKFRYLISTIPLVSLCRIIFPQKEHDTRGFANTIRYRSLVLVYLILNQERVSKEHWVYFPGKDTLFSRFSEPKNWSAAMAQAKMTSLCCELFCNCHDQVWSQSDEELAAASIDSLVKCGFIHRKNVSDYFVLRVPFAYPLLYLDYQHHLNSVFRELAKFNNLRLSGRSGTHSYYDMEECIAAGTSLARGITGELKWQR